MTVETTIERASVDELLLDPKNPGWVASTFAKGSIRRTPGPMQT